MTEPGATADDRTVSIPSHVMLREVGGETVLLNLETETYFGLDEIGTEILRLLQNGNTISATVDVLEGAFDVDRATLQRDVVELVEELVTHGLVDWR